MALCGTGFKKHEKYQKFDQRIRRTGFADLLRESLSERGMDEENRRSLGKVSTRRRGRIGKATLSNEDEAHRMSLTADLKTRSCP